jgi:hypothetical protein
MEEIMATLELYAGENTLVSTSSGLGFFGDEGFDDAIPIGSYNGHTFVTNSSGTVQGFECNNNKYDTASQVIHGQESSGISLQNLPNELAAINIRFTHGSAIYCQQAKLWIFDGSFTGSSANKDRPAENLTFYAAEIRHRSRLQTIESTYSDASWSDVSASGSNYIGLVNSPGLNGAREGGFEELSTRHDWYIALSCTPTQLGDKQFGITFELEYL